MSLFDGMSRLQLQTALVAAQTALIELQTGARATTLSYTQGDGAKSVTRKMASVAECSALIRQLQVALGIAQPRRARRFVYL
ncbi:gpW family head-tail joining protein [uncultured Sphingomonas sp.]|uniref:gpW family head-tail joining protein n=1 Tax=uncultured Sphingomonas sp. TaxID=158754 RepID=UPI00260308E9|nr:gpW family head-tail joining protein [uncultured Sphingomonas sp.]